MLSSWRPKAKSALNYYITKTEVRIQIGIQICLPRDLVFPFPLKKSHAQVVEIYHRNHNIRQKDLQQPQ